MMQRRIFQAVMVLVLASLACQAFSGGSGPPESGSQDSSSGGGKSTETDFPMSEDAFNITELGDGSLLYYTKMSQEDVMGFYRNQFSEKGYTERDRLTVVSDGAFSMVFDGDPSGMAIVIQSVDLGDGSRTVSVRREDV